MEKKYIDNSRFMEFIDEMAIQITEMNFGQETWNVDELEKLDEGYKFTSDAQEYYNEMMANNIMGVYSDNELNNIIK